jgi:hypothetical protein
VFVNVPGILPGMPRTRPVALISRLPGIAQSAAYLGPGRPPASILRAE